MYTNWFYIQHFEFGRYLISSYFFQVSIPSLVTLFHMTVLPLTVSFEYPESISPFLSDLFMKPALGLSYLV